MSEIVAPKIPWLKVDDMLEEADDKAFDKAVTLGTQTRLKVVAAS